MTISTATYSLPKLHALPIDNFDEAPEFKPELTIITNPPGTKIKQSRPYRACYLDRRSIDPQIKSLNERNKVNLSSLCIQRVKLMRPIIKGLLEGHSGIPPYYSIEAAFDWIDQQTRSDELKNLAGVRTLYKDYTNHLRHRLRLSNVGNTSKSISYSFASRLQVAMAYVCGLASKTSPTVVSSWAIRIPQKKAGQNELPSPATTSDEHELSYAMHKRYFEAFSQAVISDSTPPVVVKLTDLGFEDLIYYHQFANNANGWPINKKWERNDWMPFFYRPEGVFEGSHKEFNRLLERHSLAPIKDDAFNRRKNNNRIFSSNEFISMANYATRHFGYLLLAESGSNMAILSNIDCSKARLDKALGVASTRAIKARAGNEEQEQYVDLRFAQTIWRQFLLLREWMSKKIEAPPDVGLFLLAKTDTDAQYTPLTINSITQITYWPKNAPSLATRPARKHKTVNLVEGSSGNIALVAAMQFATPKTIERHYNFKNRDEAVRIMNDYFRAQAKAAKLRHEGVKPIRIITGGDATSTGFCDENRDEPKLIEGFEELGFAPRCSAPITCIFCVHFGLHASCEDFLRLMTIKLWIETQSRLKSINIDDHFQKFAPYINRIQQILDESLEISGEISELKKHAKVRFDRGERDPYWEAKINALVEVEQT